MNPPGNDTTFRVYLNPTEATKESKHGTYLIFHHGGGSSALSFAALAKEIKAKSGGELGVLTYDCRGHGTCFNRIISRLMCTGKTRTDGSHARATDLSLATLVSDMMGVMTHIFPDPKESPSFVVCFNMQASLTIATRSFYGRWTYLERFSQTSETWLYGLRSGRDRCRRRSVLQSVPSKS